MPHAPLDLTMARTSSDRLVEILQEWGVDTVFGLPGDGVNGIIEAFRKKKDAVPFIQVRHEEAAAFMACGYPKYTGKLGVCLATTSPFAPRSATAASPTSRCRSTCRSRS